MDVGLWLSAVGALAVLALLPWVLAAMYRSPAWGLAFVSVPLIASRLFVLPAYNLGGLTIDVSTDLATLVLLGVGGVRLAERHESGAARLAVVLVLLFSAAFLRGAFAVGIAGHLEFSGHLLLLAAIAYAISFELTPLERRRIFQVLAVVAGVLALIAVARWGGVIGRGRKVLDANPAFVIGQVGVLFLICAIERRRSTVIHLVGAGVLIGMVVLLQHRTVWVAIAFACAFVLARSGYRGARPIAAIAAGLAILFTIQFVGVDTSRAPFQSDSLFESLRTAADDDRTWEWRRDYWRNTWATHVERGPVAIVVGAGYGAPWMTVGDMTDRLEGPHNQYVEFVVRYGLLGAAAWIGLLLWAALRLWRDRGTGKGSGLSNEALLVVLLTQVIWSISYGVSQWQPLLLGLCFAAALAATRSRPPTVPLAVPETGVSRRTRAQMRV